MPLVPMRVILEAAEKGGYGVGAFNVNNMEQAQGIMKAAVETNSPLIYQVSRGALQYSNKTILRDIILAVSAQTPELPVAVHLDHGNSPESCKEAIELGFTSVMMDGSLQADGKTPADYDYNMKATKEVVDMAHAKGVTVEGEIGQLGGIEDGHGSGEEKVTDPPDVKKLFDDTKMDACALAWGTSHGAYKSTTGKPPVLRHDIIAEVHKLAPEIFIVSHGSSSVPANLVDAVNSFGVIKKYKSEDGHRHLAGYGEDFDLDADDAKKIVDFLYESERMPKSVGVPMADLKKGIQNGVRKINVDTDGRLAVTAAILSVMQEKPSEFDPRKYLGPAREAVYEFAKNAMQGFGSVEHAGDVEIVSLEEMSKRYK